MKICALLKFGGNLNLEGLNSKYTRALCYKTILSGEVTYNKDAAKTRARSPHSHSVTSQADLSVSCPFLGLFSSDNTCKLWFTRDPSVNKNKEYLVDSK